MKHDTFPAIAHIRNNSTGEVRKFYTEEYVWDRGGLFYGSIYMWEEGNYSCDCNREHFFGYANDEEFQEAECSEGKYSVNLEHVPTGEIYYKEF